MKDDVNFCTNYGTKLIDIESQVTAQLKKLGNTSTNVLTSGTQNVSLKLRIATFTVKGRQGADVYLNGTKEN